MTAGTRRNGTSKFGLGNGAFLRRPGAAANQAMDIGDTAGYRVDGFQGFDAFDAFDAFEGAEGYQLVDGYEVFDGRSGFDGLNGFDDLPGEAGVPGEVGELTVGGFGEGPGDSADSAANSAVLDGVVVDGAVADSAPGRPAAGPGRRAALTWSATRYTGRHTGRHAVTRGKATRKRVGRVVPVAAVAATLAAGTAAYVLVGGQPQTAKLNTAMSSIPEAVSTTAASGAGHANAASSGPVKVAQAKASSTAYMPKHAKPAAISKPSARPSATVSHQAAAASSPAAAAKVTTPAATPSASTSTSQAAATSTLSCNLGYSLLPDNVTAIVSFLLAHGYTDNAAAGIAGNIYQESKGNPESEGMGGGGLIGWTPLPTGYVTGNVSADLQTQLSALLTFNNGWSQYLSALNSAATPADAAYIYVTDFERAGIPAASTREASATDVASACGI